jgi:hypothetical protein
MGAFVLFGLTITFFASSRVTPPPPSEVGVEVGKGLQAFRSEEAFHAWLQAKRADYAEANKDVDFAAAPASVAPESRRRITNTQSVGIDEGGIVKQHKNHLVILRRGRLFTVAIGNDVLAPVDMQDAFAPGSERGEKPEFGAWYDELLISGDTIVVMGYSYTKGGAELVLFRIGDDGKLTYRNTYVLRSNDYYSSRNYASRLIGDTLVFYTPYYLNFYYLDPTQSLPALRHWQGKQNPGEFRTIAPASRIYLAADDLDARNEAIALHTVTTCKIADGALDCSASAVLGYAGREFYVARNAVYVWTAPWRHDNETPVEATVFRLALDAEVEPTALKAWGSPIDQFSFLESEDGQLNVLLRAEGPTASMWAAEQGSQNLAFLRVPLAAFGNGASAVARENYTPLAAPEGGWRMQNRYIGDVLVYGASQPRWARKKGKPAAYVFHWKAARRAGQPPLQKISPPHGVDRIEALGQMPLLIGAEANSLYFTPVFVASPDVASPAASLAARTGESFNLPDAAQGETRSHGFFYSPGANSGLLGLPFIRSGAQDRRAFKRNSSGVVFLRHKYPDQGEFFGKLSEAGILAAAEKREIDDHCIASCADWYGNARPLFINDRIFALMGYEIVEGRIENNRIQEVRRINFYRQLAKAG